MHSLDSDAADADRPALDRMVAAVAPSWSVEAAERSEVGSDGVYFLTVDTPAGGREVVLKTFAGEAVSPTVAPAEPRLLELVGAETDIPVPAVVGAVDDHSELRTPFFLAERLPGENGTGLFGDLAPAARRRLLADAGAHLGELHAVRSFDRFGRLGVDGDGLGVVSDEFDPRDRWADWLLADAEATLDGIEGGPFDDLVPAVRDHVRDAIPALDGPDGGAIVHWDYRLGNLLLDPDTGETTAVLDWANLVAGDPAYNLAAAEDHLVNWRTRDAGVRERLRGAFLDAYDARCDGGGRRDRRDRKRCYHLCHRLNAMACFPDWYGDAAEAVRAERAAQHRAAVRDVLDRPADGTGASPGR